MKRFEVGKTYKTTDGRNARVVADDRKVTGRDDRVIVALVEGYNGYEYCENFETNGRGYLINLIPEKTKYYVNIYRHSYCEDLFAGEIGEGYLPIPNDPSFVKQLEFEVGE